MYERIEWYVFDRILQGNVREGFADTVEQAKEQASAAMKEYGDGRVEAVVEHTKYIGEGEGQQWLNNDVHTLECGEEEWIKD
jgi:hypothetical protein